MPGLTVEHPPLSLRIIGKTFPVQHLNNALLTPLNPNASGLRIAWIDLLLIATLEWSVHDVLAHVAARVLRTSSGQDDDCSSTNGIGS